MWRCRREQIRKRSSSGSKGLMRVTAVRGDFLGALWRPLDSRLKDYDMRKGFTRKPQGDDPATRGRNYITPSGLQRLKDEHRFLLTRERPAVTKVVAWAASNGD